MKTTEKQRVAKKFNSFKKSRGDTLGRILFMAEKIYTKKVLDRVCKLGHETITPSHMIIIPHICISEGIRTSDLAKNVGLSKQAIGQFVDELIENGYLTRKVDPKDKRAKIIEFSKRGLVFVQDAISITKVVEDEIINMSSKKSVSLIKRTLSEYIKNNDGNL